MSLLTIAQDIAEAVGGIQVPQTVIGNVQATQIKAMIQRQAKQLAQRHDWTSLVRTKTFTPVDAPQQPNSVNADFDRFAGEPTMWLGSSPMGGPIGPGFWARTKAAAPHQPYPSFRFFNGSIWFTPQGPFGTDTVSYEYQSKNFVKHADETTGDRFTADTDTTFLPEELVTLFGIAAWKHSKGLDYAEDMSSAERELERIAGNDGGTADIIPYGRGYENPLGPRSVNAGAIGILSSGGYVGG